WGRRRRPPRGRPPAPPLRRDRFRRIAWHISSPSLASARRTPRVSTSAQWTASIRGRTSPISNRRNSCSSIPTNASIAAPAFRPVPWKRSSRSTRRRKSGRASSTSTRSTFKSRGRPARLRTRLRRASRSVWFPRAGRFRTMMRWTLRFVLCAAAVVAGTLVLQADDKITAGDAELQFQLGNLLSDETRFREALDAYDKATKTDDHDLQVRARAGKVKTALRIAEYELAQKEGELLRAAAPSDSEALALYADSLWSVGLFDEADEVYEQALDINKESSRARFGLARSLATRTKLDEALKEAPAAAMAPRDGEIHAEIGAIFQRLHRFDEAANAYDNFINLLPNKDRSDKAAWTRSQVKFLKAFEGRNPVEIDPEDLETTHTMPFRLVDDKIVIQAKVNGGRNQDFILD